MIAKYYTTTTALSMAKMGQPQAGTPAAAAVKSDIRFGICTGSGNGALLKENGYDYIEEGVQSLLAPKVTEEQFAQKVAQVRAAGIPIYACNGFIPAEMRVTGRRLNTMRLWSIPRLCFAGPKKPASSG
jgi:hypothetical protein